MSRDAVEPAITRSEYVRHPSFPQLPPHVPPIYAQMMTACLSQHPQDRPPFTQIQQGLAELSAQLQQSGTPNKVRSAQLSQCYSMIMLHVQHVL